MTDNILERDGWIVSEDQKSLRIPMDKNNLNLVKGIA